MAGRLAILLTSANSSAAPPSAASIERQRTLAHCAGSFQQRRRLNLSHSKTRPAPRVGHNWLDSAFRPEDRAGQLIGYWILAPLPFDMTVSSRSTGVFKGEESNRDVDFQPRLADPSQEGLACFGRDRAIRQPGPRDHSVWTAFFTERKRSKHALADSSRQMRAPLSAISASAAARARDIAQEDGSPSGPGRRNYRTDRCRASG